MGRSQETFSKKEKEKKRLKKKQDKQKKKEERKANSDGGGLDNMIAYVDEHGNITDSPPDASKKEVINASEIEIGVPPKEESDEDPIKTGTVTFFNDSKGYGFIKDKSANESYFVHVNNLMEPIAEHDKVSFEVERGPKGLIAVKVKKV